MTSQKRMDRWNMSSRYSQASLTATFSCQVASMPLNSAAGSKPARHFSQGAAAGGSGVFMAPCHMTRPDFHRSFIMIWSFQRLSHPLKNDPGSKPAKIFLIFSCCAGCFSAVDVLTAAAAVAGAGVSLFFARVAAGFTVPSFTTG